MLAPKAAEVLTLAIHELTTNALKYGALSGPHGRIDVSWRLSQKSDAQWVELDWVESGVQTALEPVRRRGFGTQLITRRVPYELHGQGTIHIDAGGLRCSLGFPLLARDSVLQTSIPTAARIGGGQS